MKIFIYSGFEKYYLLPGKQPKPELIRLMMEDENNHILELAIQFNHVNILEEFLTDQCVDIGLLYQAVLYRSYDTVEYIFNNEIPIIADEYNFIETPCYKKMLKHIVKSNDLRMLEIFDELEGGIPSEILENIYDYSHYAMNFDEKQLETSVVLYVLKVHYEEIPSRSVDALPRRGYVNIIRHLFDYKYLDAERYRLTIQIEYPGFYNAIYGKKK